MNRLFMIPLAALFLAACDGDDDCADGSEPLAVEWVCNTTTFAPGQPLTIAIETEEIDECAEPTCVAERQGGDIVVRLELDRCAPIEQDVQCGRSGGIPCELPALDEGSYALRVNGEPHGFITVDAASTETGCYLF